MARNLYDMGDARSSDTDSWLQERDERRGHISPRGALLLVLMLGGTGALLFKDLLPDHAAKQAASSLTVVDRFSACDGQAGRACVLSPDRFAYQGRSYRIGDIAAPSLENPACQQEAESARTGQAALLTLMNGGAFEIRPAPNDHNARLLMRDGVSLGALLILKGHARHATAIPVDWCAVTA